MSCERWRSALMDAALGTPPSAELEAHLAACADCRTVLRGQQDVLERIDREIHASLDTTPSAEFWSRVRQRVAERQTAPAPWLRGWMLPIAVTAGVLAVAVLVAGYRSGRPRPAPTRAMAEAPAAPAPAAIRRAQPSASAETAVASSPLHRRATGARRRQPPRPSVAEPEVLVPPGQEAAVRRLALALRQERVEPDSFLATDFKLGVPQTVRTDLPAAAVRSYASASEDTMVRLMDLQPLATESLERRNQS